MKHFIIFILLIITNSLFAQTSVKKVLKDRNEAVVIIPTKHILSVKDYNCISLKHHINKDDEYTTIYINNEGYKLLKKLNIPFEAQIPPSMKNKAIMTNKLSKGHKWDAYPTYDAYINFMDSLAKTYPEYCRLDTIGYSVEKRLILCLKISDNVKQSEVDEPKILYSSSMHGDELVGYVLMLRLADYLLTNKNNPNISELLNNTEFFINPLSNPDGAYAGGNSTVNGATRSNANGYDLNRDFPKVTEGMVAKGKNSKSNMEIENIHMVEYMKKHHFSLSINFHEGDELVNYPWDSFKKRHTDDKWFKYICRQYVDTIHTIDPSYMTAYQNGIVNGSDWYVITGGRQDYVTHFLQGREITIELSHKKVPNANLLPAFWNKNYKSLINFAKQAMYGITGTITDTSNNPIEAKLMVLNHDIKPSFTSNCNGKFFRFLSEGTYSFEVSKEGYHSKTIDNINIENNKRTELNIQLSPILVDNIKMDTIISIGVNTNKDINIEITPQNALNKNIEWSSKDTNIATINNGKIYGLSIGTTTITAKSTDGTNLSATCKVNVTENIILVEDITLTETSVSIKKDSLLTIKATVLPNNADNNTISWNSENTNIATVTNGTIKGINQGTTKIIAKANDNSGVYATCNVEVLLNTNITENQNNRIKIYPNPANKVLNIDLPKDKKLPINIIVTNTLGKELIHNTIHSHKNNIDISSLPKGIYFIKIDKYNYKIVKH